MKIHKVTSILKEFLKFNRSLCVLYAQQCLTLLTVKTMIGIGLTLTLSSSDNILERIPLKKEGQSLNSSRQIVYCCHEKKIVVERKACTCAVSILSNGAAAEWRQGR